MDQGWIYGLVAVAFVVILGIGIAYGSGKWRQFKRHPELQARREQATREVFDRTGRRSQG